MDALLPLRKLPPRDIIANHDVDFRAAQWLPLQAGAPRYFSSSPGVKRGFCATCGSPLTYEGERIPDEVHLYAAALADPSHVKPQRHVFAAEQLPWLEIVDDLPRFALTSRGGVQPMRHGPKRA